MSPEPRANPYFLGHDGAIAALRDATLSGRLHHAWLIGGGTGIGKATLAYRFARWLLAGGQSADLSVDPGHPVFKRVAANTHADLLTIDLRLNEKTKKMQTEIVIDTVHEVGKFLRLTPAEGGWRVVIVDGAELMNRSSANALLKLLEEPPKKSILLLVSHAPGRLLPTIRSRCRRLNLGQLRDGEVETLLRDYAPGLAPADQRKIAGLSEGSIGTALNLAGESGIAIATLVEEALAGPVPAARAQSIADAAARAENGFEIFFALLRAGLAAATRRDARLDARLAPAQNLAGRVTVWQESGKLEREVRTLNLDKRAAIIVTLSQLHGT